jgi:aminoglycoside 6-adenylyltransferase
MTDFQSMQIKIISACREDETIRGVIVIGSQTRSGPIVDELADLDLVLYTTNTVAFTTMPQWMKTPAPIWIPDFSYTGGGDPEWMVIYEGGYKIDYIFAPIQPDQTLHDALASSHYRIVFPRGIQVLLDKTGSADASLQPFNLEAAVHPTTAEFQSTTDNFLLEASRTAKLIQRQDLWRAKASCDAELKKKLLRMMEWHARAKYGRERDTWYDGRYLAQWADPEVAAALPTTFAAYDTADLHRAFHATLDLYYQLALETAEVLSYPYPTPGQDAALSWLRTI